MSYTWNNTVKYLSRDTYLIFDISDLSSACEGIYCTLCDMYGMLTTGYNNDQSPLTYKWQGIFQSLHALKIAYLQCFL